MKQMKHIKLFENWMNENSNETASVELKRQLSSPVGPALMKVLEWIYSEEASKGDASWTIIVSPDYKSAVFGCSFEFEHDVHPEFYKLLKMSQNFTGELMKTFRLPESYTIEGYGNYYDEKAFFGVLAPGADRSFVEDLLEADDNHASFYEMEKRYATHENILDLCKMSGIVTAEDLKNI